MRKVPSIGQMNRRYEATLKAKIAAYAILFVAMIAMAIREFL